MSHLSVLFSLIAAAEQAIGDIIKAKMPIAAGALAAVIIGLLWVLLMRCIAGCLVWILLLGLAVGLGFGAMQLLEYSGVAAAEGDFTEKEAEIMKNISYGLFIVSGSK